MKAAAINQCRKSKHRNVNESSKNMMKMWMSNVSKSGNNDCVAANMNINSSGSESLLSENQQMRHFYAILGGWMQGLLIFVAAISQQGK